jgi:predicted nucleic acid-binding protein
MSAERAVYLDSSAIVKPPSPSRSRRHRILAVAGSLLPAELRTLDAIHLATARQLRGDLARLITYDRRMRACAAASGVPGAAPR